MRDKQISLLWLLLFAHLSNASEITNTYNAVGRVVNSGVQGIYTTSYYYDTMGNRTSKVIVTSSLETPALEISFQDDNLTLQWNAISGATSYRVQSASWQGGPWNTVAAVTGTSWSTPSTLGVRLFRVVAIN